MSWPHIFIASTFLGYLALTKIIFGYVTLIGLLVLCLLYLWKKKEVYKKSLLVSLFALLFCMPYLFYTFSLTGKIFYWGTSGGIGLYLMSVQYEGKLGDWNVLKEYPKDIFEGLDNMSTPEMDDEIKRRAVRNIIKNPGKYFNNWLANVGRLFFNYPYSSRDQQKISTYFYLIPNMFLVVISLFCIYPTFTGRKIVPYEIYALIYFGLIAVGGHSLVIATNRQLWPLVPVFSLWIFFVATRVVKIQIQK
jgi:hypothetical protein